MKTRDNIALTAAASIAGLAIGAALGILLAPKKGRDLRSGFRFGNNKKYDNEDELLSDHPVEALWEKTRDHADHLQGPEKKRRDTSRIKVPSAGTMAWTEQEEKQARQPWKENNHTEGRI